MKGYARGLALKKRHKTTWKWPIVPAPCKNALGTRLKPTQKTRLPSAFC